MSCFFMLMSWIITTNFYTLQFTDIDGNTHVMSEYQGKKVLIVNIATGSSAANQLRKLQQLQDRYADSLVVIGFPSNSFAHETRTNPQIKQFCQADSVNFLLAQKNSVAGSGIQAVYQWLTTQSENGMMGSAVLRDFQKFLINESGQLIGVFAPSVDPLSPELTSALHN